MKTLQEVLTEAVQDFEANGFDSEERLQYWEEQIREALSRQMKSRAAMEQMLKEQLRMVYERLVLKGGVLKNHKGVTRFTLQNVSGRLHSELQRRILASAQLIRLNRAEMINKTLRRFSGWATSVPKGGSEQVDRVKVKMEVVKPLRQLPFVERRVLIDQGHKLTSSISATLAADGGAIAARWFSHWRQDGYDYRDEHKDRDGKVYLVRGSWAQKAGLVKAGSAGYSYDITQPTEEPFCRCKFTYLYNLKQLPPEMLTAKGKEALNKTRMAS